MFLAESSIQLVPDGTLLFHLALVVIMVGVVSRTLLRPVNTILKKREQEIATQVMEARNLSERRQEKLEQYESGLRRARSEGYRLLEQERASAMHENEMRLAQARAELKSAVVEAKTKTHGEEEKATREIELQAETLGRSISSRILGRTIQ